ncbi:MAG: hypothetical protein EKK63_15885 [Acinetobacter sp.]|uniref:hypothetical protein n=1 Tax=Acinetobacter sp. TaxID=472 RepID=UPI000F99FCA8|nr:hypothetical protein [Acinetobacter sp.]RUP37049.1 MAG: hypothetical protein EKK63_15885 [Acinetobacter sp.]
MEVTNITLNGKAYPVFFGGLALVKIYQDFKCESFEDLIKKTITEPDEQRKAGDIFTPLETFSKIAFRGLQQGAKTAKQNLEFTSPDDVLDSAKNFMELLPFTAPYSEGLFSFFATKKTEQSEGEAHGATVTAPALPLPD